MKENLREREEFENKRDKTGNSFKNRRVMSIDHLSNKKIEGNFKSSANAPTTKNKCEYNSQNFRAKLCLLSRKHGARG